ncbi:MAG: MATE family efflux transporter [Bacillota bacterium]|nr:MATE family efflux transporter [Bacillota bacterium]
MSNKNNNAAGMGEEDISKLLFRFSMPAILAMAVMASYNIVDTIFVGRLGSEAIAALSVSFPIQMLLGAVAIGTGVGAASLISRSLGAEKEEDAAIAVGQIFLLAMALGLGAMLLGFFKLRPMLILFGATPEILELTVDYMSVIVNGAVLLFLILMLNHVVRAEGNSILPMKVMIISALTNIVLDPIFIFVLDMGVRGAAVATVLAKVVGVFLLLRYYLSGKSNLTVRFRHLRPDWRIIYDIYRVGLPSLIIQMSANISIIIVNRILGGFGYIPIAIMGLVVRFQMFGFMPVIGIAQGLLPIIGFNFGAGKYPRIREALLKAAGAGTVFVTITGLAFFIFPEFFLRIFSSDEQLISTAVPAVRIMVLMYPLLGAQTISIIFFQAVGKGMSSLVLSLLRQFLLYIPFIIVLPYYFGLTGIWVATPLADMLAFIVTIMLVLRELNRMGIPLYRNKI